MAEGIIQTEKLSGIELFKTEVAAVLENTEEQPVKLSSQFTKEYKRVFNRKFKPEDYGFQSKSLYSYFTHITDIINFTKKDGNLAIIMKEKNAECLAHFSEEAVEDTRSPPSDVDCKSVTETTTEQCQDKAQRKDKVQLQDKVQGASLLRLHVMAMIEDSGEKRIDLSCFDTIYQEKYKTRFNRKNYKLKGKLTKILERAMSDCVEIETCGTKTFLKLKNSHQKQVKSDEKSEPSESIVNDRSHPLFDYPNVSDMTEMPSSKPVSLPCHDTKSTTPDSTNDSLQGIKDFRSDIKTILMDTETKKVGLGQLPHLYKMKFNCNFDHKKYSGLPKKHLCKLVQKDFMADLILIVKCGSKTSVELRGNCDDKSIEGQEETLKYQLPSDHNLYKGHVKMLSEEAADLDKWKFYLQCQNNRKGHPPKDSCLLNKDFTSDLILFEKKGLITDVKLTDKPCGEICQTGQPYTYSARSSVSQLSTQSLLEPARDFYTDFSAPSGTNNGHSYKSQSSSAVNETVQRSDNEPVAPAMSTSFTVKDLLNQPSQNNENKIAIEPCQTKINEHNSTQTSGLSGVELFKSEVREILLDQGGRIEVSKFKNLYKNKFNANFTGKKYGVTKAKKLCLLLKLIPDIVVLGCVGSMMYMELRECLMEVPEVKEDKNVRQDTKENSQAAQSTQPASPSFHDSGNNVQQGVEEVKVFEKTSVKHVQKAQNSQSQTDISTEKESFAHANLDDHKIYSKSAATQNLLSPSSETTSMISKKLSKDMAAAPKTNFTTDVILLQQPTVEYPKKSEKKLWSKIVDEEEMMMSIPSPFEDSFNAAQRMQSLTNHSLSRPAYRTPHEVNEMAKRIIVEIAEDEHYVSLVVVKAKMCEMTGVRNLKELGYRNPDIDIQELKELQRLHSKLDLYGRAYVMVHSIATLTELGQSMARLVDKKDFSELKVGPLVKLPVVYDLFKAPSDDVAIQSITTMQVLKNLNKYLTKENKWTSKVELDKFIQFLCDEYGCKSAYELGVRVQSIGLGISVLKRAQKAQSERSKEVEQELVADLEKEFERRCKKIKDDLLGASHGDETSLLQKLLGSSVTDVLTKVYEHCSLLFQSNHTITEKDLWRVERCLKSLVENKSLREFFNLALHMGCKSVVSGLLDECRTEIIETKEREEQEKERAAKPPKKGKLTKEIKKWLSSAKDLKMSTLAHIEDSITEPFRPDFPNFTAFGYGTFLEFLSKQPELNKIIEQSTLLGNSGEFNRCQSRDMGFLDFFRQCGSQSTKDEVERTVCGFYRVKTLEDLGFGNYDNVVEEIKRENQSHRQSVFYEAAILCKDVPHVGFTGPHTSPRTNINAGKLGWKTPDDALKALKSAPLLFDLQEWTQWTTVFEPCHGGLKRFIESQRKDEIQALETSGNALLRIDTNTTNDRFSECVDKNDAVGASGTLVSLVVKYGGIKNTPLTLLANHMKPVLSKLKSDDQKNDGLTCPQFVLRCLCSMPDSMCMALADKVFLEPLDIAVGKTNSCKLLLSCCNNDAQRSRLHRLGLGLGKIEFIKDFEHAISGESDHRYSQKKITLTEERPVVAVKPFTVEKLVGDDKDIREEGAEDVEPSGDVEEREVYADNEETTDEEEEEATIKPNPCKAVIETIRKEEFGIGVFLGEEEGKLFQKQREREGRSLHRLSADLYNKDTHFVLELVQNADDNTYPDTEIPALKFLVDSKSIVVLNNEVGFSEKNIRALCDVGKSTKGPHQYGYIGQKGIGFKSVFRISDTPEVHSNGYNIRFDANSGPSGYILPHWIDNCANQDDRENEFRGWMTRIVLPLKDEFQGDKKTSLTARFHDVHPSLLLFLHRLRSITIQNEAQLPFKMAQVSVKETIGCCSKNLQEMTRKDLSNNVIEINHGHGTDRWLVVKKQLNASNVREDVEMTELAIAFPMAGDSSNKTSYKVLPPQNVFAYLPLRSYGFKFIIQGDFEVPSSREDVDGDKAWNQWLREEIPKLFIDALEVFKNHPSFPGLLSISRFFQFVPLEEEILDFFAPVASAILKYLQGMPCLPTVRLKETNAKKKGNKDSERDPIKYDWMQPCTVVVCDDQEVHEFITPDVLRKHLNLNYLAQEVASSINPALRAKLGVQTLSARHVIDIGHAVLKDLDASRSNDVQWIAQWLHCIYRCLESEHNSSVDILNEIAAMDIFPLSDNKLVNLKDHVVFFPLSVDQTTKSKNKKAKVSYLADLQRDLSVLHPELLTHLENVGHSQLEKLLTRLGVKSWTPSDVIHNHILRTFKSDEWKDKSPTVLKSYLTYIFDQRLTNNDICSMEELKDCCQVLTNKGPLNPSKTPVHFTPKYGYELDLRSELKSINWTLVDDSYLQLSTHHNVTAKDWDKFFSALGVCYFIAIERKSVTLTKMNMGKSPWSSYEKNWPETVDGTYIVEDYYSSELEEFMQRTDKDPKQAKIIAENFDKLWTNQYSCYADSVPVRDTEGRELQKTLSSFLHYLREEDWVPATSSSECQVPRKLFSNTEQLRCLLDEHVLYADAKLEDESFVKAIGLESSVSAEDILQHLVEWSSRTPYSRTDACQDSVFNTSLSHMKRIYSFLHDKCQHSQVLRSEIKGAFRRNSLFFVPKDTVKMADRRVEGRFYSIKEVCWNDPSEVTQKLHCSKKYSPKRQILSPHYKESHDFLRLTLGVDPTPHTDEYIEMAAVLAEESALPTPPVVETIFAIFAVLGVKCLDERHRPNYEASDFATNEDMQINQNMAEYLRNKLQQEAIFPCSEKWVTLSDKPIVPDSKQLKKIFEKEKDVYFITLGCSSMKTKSRTSRTVKGEEKKQSDVKVFLRACGIESLSKIVEEELTPKNVEYQCHEIQKYFHDVVPCIQRYLYSHLEERYKQLKEQSFGDTLADMKFATVEKLEVVYRLKGFAQVNVGQEIKYGSESIGKALHFYAVKQHSKSFDSLNKAITKLFIDGNFINFENFLSNLSNKLDDRLENFLEEQEVDVLPKDEVEWRVPEPDIPSSQETEIPEDLLPPVVQRKVRTESDGEMHCWPPRSSVTGVKAAVPQLQQNLQKKAELWTQPEAPESMRNDPLNPKGSRLQTYISTASSQHSEVEKKIEDSDNRRQNYPEVIGATNKEPHQISTFPRVASVNQSLIVGSRNPAVVAPASGKLDPDSCIDAPADASQNLSSDATPDPISSPYPSDGTILPGCSSVIQQLSTSTPRSAGNSPSVFSPSIQIALEDLELDELCSEIEATLPLNVSLNDSSDKIEVGRTGEKIVYDYLIQQEPQENVIREIIWMNKDENSTAPFDIQVTSKPLGVNTGGLDVVNYIEVKSTSTEDKEYFEISIPELRFALEQREHLHLYRVFNIGSDQHIRILRVKNLAKHLERKSVKMFMVV